MSEQDEVELAAEVPKTSKLKLVIIGLLGTVLVGGGTVGGLYATGLLSGSAEASTADSAEEETLKEAVYVASDPAFTVNFSDQGRSRFLQLTLEVMTREPEVEESIKQHMPAILNDLMLLFSSKNATELGSRAGKEALQKDALKGIQKILEKETGEPGIEAVYFTSFVMQ